MKMGKIFVLVFVSVALIYGILSAFTTLFYRGKSIGQLSMLEIKILNREASFYDRIRLLLMNMVASVSFPPIYILSAIISGIIYLIIK